METKSINQLAQETGDSSANAAARIRENEQVVSKAWRTIAFYESEAACTLARLVAETGYSPNYIQFICAKVGHGLS